MGRRLNEKRGSRIGGFAKGVLAGLAVAALAVAALVLLEPVEAPMDVERVEAEIPVEGAEIGETLAASPTESEEASLLPEPELEPELTIRPVELPGLGDAPAGADVTGPAAGGVDAAAEPEIVVRDQPEADTGAADEVAADSEADPAGGQPQAEAEQQAEAEAPILPPALEARPISLAGPALSVNAAPFEAAAEQPLLGVIIGDVASSDLPSDVLFALPMPATVAITPGAEGDEAMASAVRARNWEVVAELPIIAADGVEQPGAMTPEMNAEEIAARTEALMGRLSQAVGALNDGDAQLADDSQVWSALAGALEQHGFAYVSASGTEGAGGDALRQEGVAYARASRKVPAEATGEEVYAALEEAAAEAEASGAAVIVVPPTRAALDALARWNAERGPGRVAPLSAVIRKQAGG